MTARQACLVLLCTALGATSAAASWNGDLNLLAGGKRLNESDWEPTHRHGELGLQTNWNNTEWPVSLAADFLFSGSSREPINRGGFTEQDARTSEMDLGVRKIWRTESKARPYIGGGLAVMSAEIERRNAFFSVEDHDDAVGLWLGGGIYWTLTRALNLGLDAKLSGARVRLFGADRNAGGLHLGLLLGYHWGG